MRIKDGFVMREVAGQTMVIATGEASRNFHGMIKLNSTGKMIWEGLMQGLSRQEITERITETCDAEPGQVQEDVGAFLEKNGKSRISCTMKHKIEEILQKEGCLVTTTAGVSMYPMLRNRRDTVVVPARSRTSQKV